MPPAKAAVVSPSCENKREKMNKGRVLYILNCLGVTKMVLKKFAQWPFEGVLDTVIKYTDYS